MKTGLLAVFAAFLGAAPAFAAVPPSAPQIHQKSATVEIDRAMTAAAAKGFGGVVIIEQGGTTLIAKGYGYANREQKIPFTADTVAQIGSITKSQTAAAIATLIAQGKVSLSDPVAKFVPEAPEPGRSRTVAQLLSHRSGLLDACTGDFERQSISSLVRDCLARPLAHKPGEENYSNMGYSTLALILERVTGKHWESVLRERVWRPLGMRDIGFYFNERADRRFAHGYLNNTDSPVISRSIAELSGNDWALQGNGGIQASSRAMIRFLDGLLDPASGFSPTARTLILSPLPGHSGEVREGFGLAFRYHEDGSLYRVGHSGSDGTFFSYLCWLPANDVRFYFVGNNGEDNVKPVLQQALKSATNIAASPTRKH